ncbi:MAG: hypothetical protein AAF191_14040, partial [Verrucomicrobiota bacterium]
QIYSLPRLTAPEPTLEVFPPVTRKGPAMGREDRSMLGGDANGFSLVRDSRWVGRFGRKIAASSAVLEGTFLIP